MPSILLDASEHDPKLLFCLFSYHIPSLVGMLHVTNFKLWYGRLQYHNGQLG